MLRIKEFATVCQCSVYTLRYYDRVGLLKPKIVDAESHYRYYCEEQLKDFQFIKLLQNAGFNITEILNFSHMERGEMITNINNKIINYKDKIIILDHLKEIFIEEERYQK